MPESRVRILVVNPKLSQAVGIKAALEALSGFEVKSFTSPLNALAAARTAPPDAAVLDLAMRSPNIGEASVALRKLNPNIKLLLTNAPEEALTKLRADGQIVLPARAREIEPLLRGLFPLPVSDNRPPTPSIRPDGLKKTARNTAIPAESVGPDPFERIASEEPPIPTGTEGGTVREAVRTLLPRQPLDESMYVVEITPRPSDTDEGQPVRGDSTVLRVPPPAETIPPADHLVPDEASPPAFDDSDADLDEPDSAGDPQHTPTDSQPTATLPPPLVPTPTTSSSTQRPTLKTLPIDAREPTRPSRPRRQPPDFPGDIAGGGQPPADIKIPGQRRPVKKKQAETTAPEPAAESGTRRTPLSSAPAPIGPAELRRVLVLTHEQIGTAASALILTQDADVLAHSGDMPTQEIQELEALIGGDWNAHGEAGRIRYVTLPTSRQDYMLHTRRTENGYTLSMAFAGDVPVREIRAQSAAVAATLETMYAADGESSLEAVDQEAVTPLLSFTAVWMLENPDDPLTADIAQAVVLEFDARLRELDWPIHAMNVHADFVYIYCGVQTTYLASEVVAELKRISAEAAAERRPDWSPDTLWADAYMALMPGRELGSDEVQSFLDFTRSRLRGKAE